MNDTNPAFDLTHEKSMVVDDETAFVKSLNWATKNLTETRDYAVVTTRPPRRRRDHRVLRGRLASSSLRAAVTGAISSGAPAPGATGSASSSTRRRHRLFVQNERFQDMVIIERLVRAARRGVKVHVMARPPHTLKREKLVEGVGGLRIMDDVGIKVHKLKHLKLHGKMLLADGVAAIVGSINFAAGSLDGRRELAIEMRDDSRRGSAAQGRQARLGPFAPARSVGRGTAGRSRGPHRGQCADARPRR